MQVPAHHPHQELIAKKLFGISTVDHLESLKMVSNCARAATDEYIKLEEKIKELEARDPWDLVVEEEFARIADVRDKDGKTQIILEGPLFARFILLLGFMIKDHPGYVEFRCKNEAVGELLVTCQKVKEPTPSEKVAAYREAFLRLKARLQESEGSAKLENASVTLCMAVKMLEEEWKKVPNEETYRVDEDHDREPVQIEGTDAGEPSELPGEGERSS